MPRTLKLFSLLIATLGSIGCADSRDGGSKDSGSSANGGGSNANDMADAGCDESKMAYANACDAIGSVAEKLGCAPFDLNDCFDGCEDPACADEAEAWIACIEEDTTQCLCEEDDQSLNCEGSHKPSEGPANCVVQFEAFESCATR